PYHDRCRRHAGACRLVPPRRLHMLPLRPLLVGLTGLLMLSAGRARAEDPVQQKAPGTTLRFEVTVAKGLLEAPVNGRLLVVMDPPTKEKREPRTTIGE